MENGFQRFIGRVRLAAMIFAVLSALAVAAAVLVPLPTEGAGGRIQTPQRVPTVQPPHKPWDSLQSRIAGQVQEMIKPLQGIAAVKDDGAAAKMAQRLKLQGIVNMDGQYVAYVCVDKGSVVALKTGGTVLEFSVLNVEEKTVTLCREGVQVVLPQSPQ